MKSLRLLLAWLWLAAVAFGTPVFYDTFTDTAGTLLSGHTPETGSYVSVTQADDGTTPDSVLKIQSGGVLYADSTTNGEGGRLALIGQQTASADCLLTFVIDYNFSSRTGARVRWDSGANTYYQITTLTNGQFQIVRVVGGQNLEPYDGVPTIPLGANTVQISVVNETSGGVPTGNVVFTFYLNGVLFDTYVDNTAGLGGPIVDNGDIALFYNTPFGVGSPADDLTSWKVEDVSSALTSGGANPITATDIQVKLSSTAPTGGTGSYTYCWHRSTTAGFTPDGGNALSSLGNNASFEDLTAVSGTNYRYILETSDGTDTVYSNEIGGRLWMAPLTILFAGDSITAGVITGTTNSGTYPGIQTALAYAPYYERRIVNTVNQGHAGATTADWLPGGSYYLDAVSAGQSSGATVVHIVLGTNDANSINNITAATYKANLVSISAGFLADGFAKVVISYPTGSDPLAVGPIVDNTLLESYFPKIDELANGTTIFAGDKLMRYYLLENPSHWNTDGLHFTSTDGYPIMGKFWSTAIFLALHPQSGGGSSGVVGSGFLGF